MAELFGSSTDNVGLHLKNIFSDSELKEAATTEDFSVVQSEGGRSVRRRVKHYNLDAIISVGYRVNSHRGVRFRQWATSTLREHLVRGYTLNRQRLEQNARELESALALVHKAAGNRVDHKCPRRRGSRGRGSARRPHGGRRVRRAGCARCVAGRGA
ncbi:MAG: RhuM family protein [Steroidobacteraceae bacterium]